MIAPGDLVISEIFADPSNGDAGREWFEIYNSADQPIELEGLTLIHGDADGSNDKRHVMAEIVIAPGQFFTLGDTAQDATLPWVEYGYGDDLGQLANTGGTLSLACGDTTIDTTTYGMVDPGHSRELSAESSPDASFNDDQANWCVDNVNEFEPGNFGTPGQDNDCIPVAIGQCLDNGSTRMVMTPTPGDLVISEVMPSPSKVPDADGEWFEARAMTDVDLVGLRLDRAADTKQPDLVGGTDCLHVPAGGYALFAKSVDTAFNGGLPDGVVAGTFTFSLIAGTVDAPGDVRILAGDTVIDSVTWTHSTNGASRQLDPAHIDPQQNDDEANFCDGTEPYGLGDLGTPAADNLACSSQPPPGMCTDLVSGLSRAIVPPLTGALVISEIMPNPKVEPEEEWFEITNTSSAAFDLNGLGLDRVSDTRVPDVISSPECKPVAPGGYALFAHSSDPASNGMLPAVDATFGFTMVNTAGDVRVLAGTTVLDAVTWSRSTDGVSAQLDPSKLDETSNDTAANFCPGTTAYGDGVNLGTPKAPNAACP